MNSILKSFLNLIALLLVVSTQAGTVNISGTRLNFLADPGEENNVTIDLVAGAYNIRDTGAAITPNPGNGFIVVSANEVTISASGISGMDVVLGDQNDYAQVTSNVAIATRFIGGEGDDTMLGGSGDDTFYWGTGFGGGLGNDVFDGGGGTDLLRFDEDSDLILSDTVLQAVGYTVTFAGLEKIDLTGGPGNNRFDASAVTASSGFSLRFVPKDGDDVMLGGGGDDAFFWGNGFGGGLGNDVFDGGGGTDLLRFDEDSDLILSDTVLQAVGYTVTFAGLEKIDLTGGPGNNRFDASAVTASSGFSLRFVPKDGDDVMLGGGGDDAFFWGNGFGGGLGNDVFDGGGGIDLLRFDEDADLILSDTVLQAVGYTVTFAGLEKIDLTGGPGNNRFDASAVTASSGFSLRFIPKDGDDVMLGGGGDDAFFWGNGFGGGLGNDVFDGGGGNDLFRIDEDADMILSDTDLLAFGYTVPFAALENIDFAGGPGNNTLDASAVTAASGLSLRLIGRGGDDVLIGGEIAVQFFGESGSDTVVASPGSHTWHVTSANSGDLDGYPFQSVENLIGGTGNDLFIFGDGASLSGRIDGNAGTDTIDWNSFTSPPVVNVTGAGSLDGSQGTASNLGGGFDNIENLLPPQAQFVFDGFHSPIGGADATGGSFLSPKRTFKLGSTIPVKFSITSDGTPVVTGIHTLQAIKWSSQTNADPPMDATPTDAATSGNQFHLVGNEWHFNLDTKATGMSAGIWQLIASLSDGSQHSVWIQIK